MSNNRWPASCITTVRTRLRRLNYPKLASSAEGRLAWRAKPQTVSAPSPAIPRKTTGRAAWPRMVVRLHSSMNEKCALRTCSQRGRASSKATIARAARWHSVQTLDCPPWGARPSRVPSAWTPPSLWTLAKSCETHRQTVGEVPQMSFRLHCAMQDCVYPGI